MARRNRAQSARTSSGTAAPSAAAPGALPVRWILAALLSATFLAYLPAVSGPFLFDDLNLEPLLQSPPSWTFLLARLARSVTNMSLVAEVRLMGLDVRSFHITNILLHLLNGLLVRSILERLLAMRGPLAPADRFAALAGAGLFLLHPIQTEAVAYISSRSEVLCALFSYLAFFLFLGSAKDGEMPFGRALAVAALLALGTLSKEPAVAMVGVFIAHDVLSGGTFTVRPLLRRWRLYVPLLAVAGAIGGKLYSLLAREGTAGASGRHAPLDYLLTQCKVVWEYFRLAVFPFGQNLDHDYPVVKAPGDAWVWLGLAALAALLAAAWRWRQQFPLVLFGLLFQLILRAPTSSIVPIDDAMAERRLYLGFPGIAMAAAELLRRMRLTAAAAAAAIVLLLFGALTWRRAALYTSAERMWADSVAANPNNSRAWFHLAYAVYQQGRCQEATEHYAKAGALAGKPEYNLLVDWANALECAGRLQEAAAKLEEAEAVLQRAEALLILGRVLAKQGELGRALEVLDEAARRNPSFADTFAFRGNVRLLRNEPAAALADYEQALRLDPGNSAALKGRRSALAALKRSP